MQEVTLLSLAGADAGLVWSERFATYAHEGQKRKYTGEDYIVHPRRVFNRVNKLKLQHDLARWVRMGKAGWCHDIGEDCLEKVPDALEQIRHNAGEDTLLLVLELTNPSKQYPRLARSLRKTIDREHIRRASWEAKCLKMIDRHDNLNDLALCPDLDFLKLYSRESWGLLEATADANELLARELEDAIRFVEKRLCTL